MAKSLITGPDPESLSNVAIIGFMGSGKTTVGQHLAKMLQWDFVDTDQWIETHCKCSITKIFSKFGEDYFRERETEALIALGTKSSMVISTGGGIVTCPAHTKMLRALGCVIWLDVPAAQIWERVRLNRNRPLLKTKNPQETIRTMLAERTPLYRSAAHIRIDPSNLSPDEVAYGIAETIRLLS